MRISVRQRIGPGVGTLCLVLGALFLPRPASAQDQQPTQPSSSQKDNQVSQRRGLGVIFATDGRPLQSARDF